MSNHPSLPLQKAVFDALNGLIAGVKVLLVGHLHRNREAASEVALKEIPFGVQSILDRYRATGLG